MSDTRTTTPSQIAAGALTSHPVPKVRTVSTTQATGELSLRYIPRPTPSPDVPETKCGNTSEVCVGIGPKKAGKLYDAFGEETLLVICADPYQTLYRVQRHPDRAALAIGGTAKSLLPCPDPVTAVPRPGPDTLINRDYHIARLRTIVGLATTASRDDNKLTMETIVSLAESIVDDLVEGKDPISLAADAHRQAVAIAQRADQERRAAAREENDRDERLLGLSHTYRRELLCFPV